MWILGICYLHEEDKWCGPCWYPYSNWQQLCQFIVWHHSLLLCLLRAATAKL